MNFTEASIVLLRRETDRDSNPNFHFCSQRCQVIHHTYSVSPTRKQAKNYTTRKRDIVEKSLLGFLA